MEGGSGGGSNKESSKASSDDHGSTDQSADDDNSGKFYECIFCKRGFSTAQALGGHMNIHRKDRAKMKNSSSVSSKPGYYNPYANHNNNSHRSFYPPVSESLKNYSMFFPAAAARGIASKDAVGSIVRPRELSLFGEDQLHLGLRVHAEGRRVVLGHEERRERDKEGEVDLELRLGIEP